ncbi:MAG: hypothetical protein AAF357_00475 [Verrucomicrobiota bacterium]
MLLHASATLSAGPLPPQTSATPNATLSEGASLGTLLAQSGEKQREMSLPPLELSAAPKVLPRIIDDDDDTPRVFEIRPGETISGKLRAERPDFTARVEFGKDTSGRNLPHGVYIDNIGLNGLMIPEGQTEQTFFITAAPWVPAQERTFHFQTNANGKQTTRPVTIQVIP